MGSKRFRHRQRVVVNKKRVPRFLGVKNLLLHARNRYRKPVHPLNQKADSAMYPPLRTQLIQKVPWFFKPAFDHLGFLSRDHSFSYDGESPGGPDNYARLVFTDDTLQIEVLSWLPMDLPTLTVTTLGRKRTVLDLNALGFSLATEPGDYYQRYRSVPPLDKQGRAAIDREFEIAVAHRMMQFGSYLRQHLHTLKKAA